MFIYIPLEIFVSTKNNNIFVNCFFKIIMMIMWFCIHVSMVMTDQ